MGPISVEFFKYVEKNCFFMNFIKKILGPRTMLPQTALTLV